MGKIVLKTQNRVVAGQERITTSKVNYSTIGSDLICARVAQTANIKVTTVKSALLGIKEAVRYFVCNGHSVNLGPMGIQDVKQEKVVKKKDNLFRSVFIFVLITVLFVLFKYRESPY